jgi:hypothetical protein
VSDQLQPQNEPLASTRLGRPLGGSGQSRGLNADSLVVQQAVYSYWQAVLYDEVTLEEVNNVFFPQASYLV